MQKDSMHSSTSGSMAYDQAVTKDSPVKSFQCSHCPLVLKSKVYFFDHLNNDHGLDVDVALREAGFKTPGTDQAATDNDSNSSDSNSERCQSNLKEEETLSENKSENQNVIKNLINSENSQSKMLSAGQHKEAAEAKEISSVISVTSTSKTKCALNSSKDLKTYNRPLQTITKYFRSSPGSNEHPTVKSDDNPELLDGTKGTLILQESPRDSSPNSSGVFKVTAKPMIDISLWNKHQFLLNDHLLNTDLRPPKPKEHFKETVPDINVGKRRYDNESFPAKKSKSDKDTFEFSEDEEELKVNLVNGKTDCPEVYSCKHCDYSDVSISCVSNHYHNFHPYIRYKTIYIQDQNDRSATFRCLECPVEFISEAVLKKHYQKSHPEAPNVFKMQSQELCLVFKCFVCTFTTNELIQLKAHYTEKHPKHAMDNSLMYCRYAVTRCLEGSSQFIKRDEASSPGKSQDISHDNAHTPCKEVRNPPSSQHPTSQGAEMKMYHCDNCKFSHKSIVVMHVHYQKSHPGLAVTMDKIKQSAHITSGTVSQVTPDNCSTSVTIQEISKSPKCISDSCMETRNEAELSRVKEIPFSSTNPKTTPNAPKTTSESDRVENVKSTGGTSKGKTSVTKLKNKMSTEVDCSSIEFYYCQLCSYTSANVKSIIGHHNAKHTGQASTDTAQVLLYSAMVQKKKLQSQTGLPTKTKPCDSETSEHLEVRTENELQLEEKEPVEDEPVEDEPVDASATGYNAFAYPENLFYCQKCNYGNTSAGRILTHQARVHRKLSRNLESILEYTAVIRGEIEKSKSQQKESSFSSRLPLPLIEKDEKEVFFCHFCNFRQNTIHEVLRHYSKRHHGFEAKEEQVRIYTAMVFSKTEVLQLKTPTSQEVNQTSLGKKDNKRTETKKVGKFSASSPRALQTQRSLQCNRCPYITQNLYLLRRHMQKTHRTKSSVVEILKMCFEQGSLKAGYHCDMCYFSHKKAVVVYRHYQRRHKDRKRSLEYVNIQLGVGLESLPFKKKLKAKPSDGVSDDGNAHGNLPSQSSEQNEAKTYSCRACSFKSTSVVRITSHYRVVHPWSVKEDGSVPHLINSKKYSTNRQMQDENEILQSIAPYQTPLKCEKSSGSSHEAVSSKKLKCPICHAMFPSKRGLNIHCGMKHQQAIPEDLAEEQEEEEQIQPHMHVFKCPHCTYVNNSYHGVLTHCQMRHPDLESSADSQYVEKVHIRNSGDCIKPKGSGMRLRGYMCKSCPQICATPEKLNKHDKDGHNDNLASTEPRKSKSAPEPPAVSKKKLNTTSKRSALKASFISKKMNAVIRCQYCSYTCTSKFALGRHQHLHHKNVCGSKAPDCSYRCTLCSKNLYRKARLGLHYAKKHGKEAFLKYFASVYKKAHEKPASAIPYPDLIHQPKNTSVVCPSSRTEEENKKIVYMCPICPYVHESYHGTLTHCQMRHPDIVARADELKTGEVLVSNMVRCTLGKGSNVRGYVCDICPQVHVSLKKLKIHLERDHRQGKSTVPRRSVETEEQSEHGCADLQLEIVSVNDKITAAGAADGESCQSDVSPVKDKEMVYKCSICSYIGSCRKYLHTHYKNAHKLDSVSASKLLVKYNKRNRTLDLPAEDHSEDSAPVKCKKCPNITFESSQLLIDHYSTIHSSDCKPNFVMLSKISKKSSGLYRCVLCDTQLYGISKLCRHLDRHRETKRRIAAKTAKIMAPVVATLNQSVELCSQDELPILETVEELAQWNVTPAKTFTLPPSPQSSPSKPTESEQCILESKEDNVPCKQCGRTFMSLKGLRSHERGHAAVAAIKKLNNISTSALKRINKYLLFKDGTMRPFRCSLCSYKTTVMGLWRGHFIKSHRDVLIDPAETDDIYEENIQQAYEELPDQSEELKDFYELDEEPVITEKSLYLEPPDVQRQLNHYTLMSQAGAPSKADVKESRLPQDSMLHCEVCNFSTGHLSSMRRHYLNRHGKKMLRCKDCEFFTGSRKTLEMHMKMGHSTCQSELTHEKVLRCPFCLYQTKNKNNMIDHIVLHREERVVPIEVRRPKLSRYLQGIVFRCHKCTFTSGSAENLRLHMAKHDDVKPFKCRLCFFDCARLSSLEAHLSDKHQVLRNHELVGQISLDQLEARVSRIPEEAEEEEEPLSDKERHGSGNADVKTEEFVPDYDEVPLKRQAENPAEEDIRQNLFLKIKEVFHYKGQDGRNRIEEGPARSSVLELECEKTTPIAAVQEKQEQGTEEKVHTAMLLEAAREKRIGYIGGQKSDEGKNADIQYEDCNRPEIFKQANENQTQLIDRENEVGSITFTQQNKEATHGRKAEEADDYKLHIKGLKHRALNVEARIEDDILRHVLLMNEDDGLHKVHKKSDQDITVKTEEDIDDDVDNVLIEIPLLNEEGGKIRKNQVHLEAKTKQEQTTDLRAQECLTVERPSPSLTLGPNCRQLRISPQGILGMSFTNYKDKQEESQKKFENVRDPDGEMPALQSEGLKEEMQPLSCCKDEDQTDHLNQYQDQKEELITEEDGNQRTNLDPWDSDRKKEAFGAATVTDGAATEQKLFTCGFCGRNLMNNSELERHIIRHGI